MSEFHFSPEATKSVVMKLQQERDDALKQIKELKELLFYTHDFIFNDSEEINIPLDDIDKRCKQALMK